MQDLAKDFAVLYHQNRCLNAAYSVQRCQVIMRCALNISEVVLTPYSLS